MDATRFFLAATLGSSLATLGLAQVTPEWQQTYVTPALANALDRTTAVGVSAGGDIFWASDHAFLDPASGNWLQRTELHRTSAGGALLWTVQAPASDVLYDRVLFDAAGDVYFTGRAGVLYSLSDALVTKVSPGGSVLWTRTINGATNDYDVGFASLEPSGGVAFVGCLDLFSRVFVRKYDALGNVIFHTSFVGWTVGIDVLRAAERLPGGDFAVCGYGNDEPVIARLDTNGNLLWRSAVPLQTNQTVNQFTTLTVDAAGRIAAAGHMGTTSGTFLGVVRVCDANGNVLLDRTLPSALNTNARLVSFAQDGSLWVVFVEQTSAAGGSRMVIERFDPNLALAHSTVVAFPGAGNLPNQLVTGEAGQAWLLTDSRQLSELAFDGTIDWSLPLAAGGGAEGFGGLKLTADRRFVAFGWSDPSGTFADTDALLARFDARTMPRGYCTSIPGVLGCSPALAFHGRATAGAASGFELIAAPWRNGQPGLFVYGTGPAIAVPSLGGTLCVGQPRARTTPLVSGGTPPPASDCSGALALDFAAFASGALGGLQLPGLQSAGTAVRAQAWSRDPGSPSGALLSNALEFTLLP